MYMEGMAPKFGDDCEIREQYATALPIGIAVAQS